jgi:hypothetical protein
MRGVPWIEDRVILPGSLAKSGQLPMLAACLAVGVLAGILVAAVRLNLGLPGHKALLWMPPILVARRLSRCRGGVTAGGAAMAGTTFGLGGHLAGGFAGLPLILAACAFLDLVIHWLESKRISGWRQVPMMGLAALVANLICLTKRLALPAGSGAHLLLDTSGFWFRFGSYACFGLVAGLVAAVTVQAVDRGRRRG